MTIVYEFIGGPKDGEFIAHPDPVLTWRIPFTDGYDALVCDLMADEPPSLPLPTRIGIYRVRRPGSLLLDWQGEE